MSRAYHVPVLAEEVLRFLPVDPDGVYVDATLGGGGHARLLASRLGPRGLLLGLDRDPAALAEAGGLEAEFPGRVRLRRGDFGRLPAILEEEGTGPAAGLLVDLGVSSHQLDEGARGFSFLRDGPLDMRMGPDAEVAAEVLVNTLPEAELARLFREYGEEPRAARVARAIARVRTRRPLRSTGELARVVEEALGRRSAKHPATRVFQALRIAVNRELEALDALLEDLPTVLASGGRVVIIAYHSLEDRRVKQGLRRAEARCRCAPAAPICTCGEPGFLRILNRKAIKASREEVVSNPRARSARLRAAERLPRAPSDPGEGGHQP